MNHYFGIFNDDNIYGIQKYNINTKTWQKFMGFHKNIPKLQSSTAFDPDKNILYIFDRYTRGFGKQLDAKIDLNTKQLLQTPDILRIQSYSALCINDKLYMIRIQRDKNQSKFVCCDDKMQNFEELYTFKQLEGYGMVHIKRNKEILLFGGWLNNESEALDTIRAYSLDNNNKNSENRFRELKVKLPLCLSHFGIVSTRNDQFVIIIGGWIDGSSQSDGIYIFDVNKCELRESEIRCPSRGYTYATIIDNTERDELLVFGFIRRYFKNLHDDLIHLLTAFVCNQIIFARCAGEMWMIDVNEII